MHRDGSDSTTASTAIGYAKAMIQQYSAAYRWPRCRGRACRGRRRRPGGSRVRFWYNPELKSSNFIVPGLIAVNPDDARRAAHLDDGGAGARARDHRAAHRLAGRRHELMLGKLLPYVVIAFVDIVLVIAAGRLLFRVPLVGSPALLLAAVRPSS